MVDITYSPVRELVVHEVVKVEMDDLLRERITPAGNMPLYWCDGVLFSFSSLPMTKKIVDDYIRGTIHWMEVHYSKMKEYAPVAELNDEHYNSVLKIRVIDTSKSELHRDFAKWLNKSLK
ncbi:MAG: hypothetical protein M1559_03530 [Candidatus Marsarchaeota archaeon]|jgi:hypothetical protein|nr:hypothetical protein [Candidatus Marsarchaeota archaeon]